MEGESATIVADGGVHPKKTVTSGTVAFDYQVGKAHIGLGYTGMMKTLNLEGGGITGSGQSKPTAVNKVLVRFLDSLGAKVGSNRYRLEDIPFRSSGHATSRPAHLHTGYKEVSFEDS